MALQYNFSLQVGFKPAGGIRTPQDALEWVVLVKEELGQDWLTNSHFRIGASNLLDHIINDIVETYGKSDIVSEEGVLEDFNQESFKSDNEAKAKRKSKFKKGRQVESKGNQVEPKE